ncbi:MAG: methyltransferase domain-containing protein [Acidobacteria bacterium]|nr:methyltransferase domain-containing protein [Acidobacteriota bacterium]
MDLVERQNTYGLRHPWETARAGFIVRLLRQMRLLSGGSRWLDVGSGDAWLAHQVLAHAGAAASAECWDVNYSDDDIAMLEAAEDVAPNIGFGAERPNGSFDRILMLDVIEHVEDDVGFVSSIVQDLLAPDGFAIVTVPAYQALFGDHDRALHHFRRYSPTACRGVLEESGLTVLAEGGLFHSLLVLRAAGLVVDRVRRSKQASVGVGGWSGGPFLTRAMDCFLSTEARVSLAMGRRGWVVPGLSYWAVCSRHGS